MNILYYIILILMIVVVIGAFLFRIYKTGYHIGYQKGFDAGSKTVTDVYNSFK